MGNCCAKLTALLLVTGHPSFLCRFDERPLRQGSLQVGSRTNQYCQKLSGQVRCFPNIELFSYGQKWKTLTYFFSFLLSVAKDYVRLMKYGDSLYRCKQLKRAALGRMCTIVRRQKQSLEYLEQGASLQSRPECTVRVLGPFENLALKCFGFILEMTGSNYCSQHNLWEVLTGQLFEKAASTENTYRLIALLRKYTFLVFNR